MSPAKTQITPEVLAVFVTLPWRSRFSAGTKPWNATVPARSATISLYAFSTLLRLVRPVSTIDSASMVPLVTSWPSVTRMR
ncbi:hypothetical protein D3C78_1830030 [compost metagenome]